MRQTVSSLLLLSIALGSSPTLLSAADFSDGRAQEGKVFFAHRAIAQVKGRATALDGRTLWFAQAALKVALAGIDSCELPQWSFDPYVSSISRLRPVPCGPFAKAWLKRTIGNQIVDCRIEVEAPLAEYRCLVEGRDIGREMLRVGWAKTSSTARDPAYASAERCAMAARYGMWATYVLDMDEWRAKAIDRTADRRPIADLNLLKERRSEISPPFADARRLPPRTDR
jgi:endonuclease YncB( thermonuclease family)